MSLTIFTVHEDTIWVDRIGKSSWNLSGIAEHEKDKLEALNSRTFKESCCFLILLTSKIMLLLIVKVPINVRILSTFTINAGL